MQRLQQLQRDLQNYILQADEKIKNHINPSMQQDRELGLTIYRDAYQIRLVDILMQEHPLLAQLFGEIPFKKLLSEYLYYFPSKYFSVSQVGVGLANFLAQKENIPAFYKEIALLERAITQAMIAEDAEILTMEDLAKIDPEDWPMLQFYFHPSVQMLRTEHDIVALNNALVSGHQISEIERCSAPQMIIVWRQQQRSCYRSLSGPESYLLKHVAQQCLFEQLYVIMLEFFPEEEAMQWIAQTLQYWINEGIFVAAPELKSETLPHAEIFKHVNSI